jgi:hypothetical protein
VQVWRANATAPQTPVRRGLNLGQALLTGTESVSLQLFFDSSAAGKSLSVRPGGGVTLDPPDAVLQIRPTGECALTMTLDESIHRSSITFVCDGIKTRLQVQRVPAGIVAAAEAANTGGAR